MSDFDLERSRWWNVMKVSLACKNSRTCAETIIDRARVLANFDYDAVVGKELADAETQLTEALFAVQVARVEYEKNAGVKHLVAAE